MFSPTVRLTWQEASKIRSWRRAGQLMCQSGGAVIESALSRSSYTR